MVLRIMSNGEKQYLNLNGEEVRQLCDSLSLEIDPGLPQTEQEKMIQAAFDAAYNRPEYNNWHKHNRHTVGLGIRNRGNDAAGETDEPLMEDVADDRIFKEDELLLENRDSYEVICRRIRSALRDKPRWAAAFIAVRMGGVSVKEYASSIGVSDPSVVSYWLKRAEKKLKIIFQNRQI